MADLLCFEQKEKHPENLPSDNAAMNFADSDCPETHFIILGESDKLTEVILKASTKSF